MLAKRPQNSLQGETTKERFSPPPTESQPTLTDLTLQSLSQASAEAQAQKVRRSSLNGHGPQFAQWYQLLRFPSFTRENVGSSHYEGSREWLKHAIAPLSSITGLIEAI